MKQAAGACALLLLCLILFLPGQKTLPPFDRDEARFAQASRQMVETGDYVDIRFQDAPRHKKPVGIYWLQTLSAKATGAVDAIWAYRVPSWVGATLAVLLTASLGASLFTPATGALAGVILASTLLMGVEARMAKTDAVQLLCVVVAQSLLARAWMGRGAATGTDMGRDRGTDKGTGRGKGVGRAGSLMFGAALGAGLLVKGPIVLMVVGLTALSLALLSRSAAWLKPLLTRDGLALGIGIVLPWVLVITVRTHGRFWVDSVGHDLLAKAASGQEGHGAPPGYYLVTFFLTFWPWGVLALPAAWTVWKSREDRAIQFLVAWIVPVWLVFELMPTKLLHYTLPAFPAVALLIAGTLQAHIRTYAPNKAALNKDALNKDALNKDVLNKDISAQALPLPSALQGWGGLAAVGGVLLAGVALGVPLMPPLLLGESLSFADLTAGVLLLGAGGAAWFLRTLHPKVAGLTFMAGLLNFYVVAFGQTLPAFNAFWVSRSAAELVNSHRAACSGPVTALGYAEPSLVFLLGTTTRLASHWPSETGCHLVLRENRFPEPPPARAQVLGSASGFNYSKGEPVTLTLFLDRVPPHD